jgi:hypothetical protein
MKIEVTSEDNFLNVMFAMKERLQESGPFSISLHNIADLDIADQRGYYWSRVRIFSQWNGDSKDKWHFFFKENYLLPIFARDIENHPDIATLIKAMQYLKNQEYPDYQEMRRMAIDKNVSHLHATKANMADLLNAQEEFAREHNLYLPPPRKRECQS